MALAGTLRENFPSKSGIVPVVVPFTWTETPIRGSPVSSKIVPVTVLVWLTTWVLAKFTPPEEFQPSSDERMSSLLPTIPRQGNYVLLHLSRSAPSSDSFSCFSWLTKY